ncbi:fungal-specific transcription factor domain-containing protein [Talaromyces proteolyticus]|uniref:Fungal-specific transcription factor domain-containing protein n=1 Tax=Talaromyces proteolyticus TaxID=1131652 RepID=A0AAD4KND2_9EURO|nr:fungal-specific transcription factor domain-containing protein [Talaromyces proteolyticus]KAH8695536.1 fungal-specific transcription factor domain-containing protein [Talaromyces proteolyticus]
MQGSFQRFRVSRPKPRKGEKPSLSSVNERATLPPTNPSQGERSESSARQSTQSACLRCRRLKKKCTRTRQGGCRLCMAAWLPCSFPRSIQDSQEREKSLQERISWLSAHVNRARPLNAIPVELVETGNDLAIPQTSELPDMRIEPITRLEDRGVRKYGLDDATGFPKHALSKDVRTISRFVDKAAGRRFVEAYFRHVHRAYPFLDRDEVFQDVDLIYVARDKVVAFLEIPTRLSIIMAVGRTTLQRADELGDAEGARIDIPDKEIIHECLCKSDLTSVEILTLLALYSLFEAGGVPAWGIIGILARKVISMGLARDSSLVGDMSQVEMERRRRLLWSVYVLDRMISVSYGLAPSLSEEDIKIPLPSVTVEEYASADRSYYAMTLQINRHVVSLRQLEGKILQAVHLTPPMLFTQGMMAPYIDDIRREIDDWYTQGCLLSSSTGNDNDQIPFHNTISWHNARYQNLLVLLYSPSKLNFQHSVERVSELHAAAQKYVQSTLVLQQQRHLPLNWITLCRFLTMGAILYHCYIWRLKQSKSIDDRNITERTDSLEYKIPGSSPSLVSPLDKDASLKEIANDVFLCAKFLDLFPASWQTAKQAAAVFWQFAEYISAQQSTANIPNAAEFELSAVNDESPFINKVQRNFDPVLDAIKIYNDKQRPLSSSGVELTRNKGRRVSLKGIRKQILQLIKTNLGDTSIYAYAVREDESVLGLMNTMAEEKLLPFNDFVSTTTNDLFQGSNISPNDLGSRRGRLWLDFMDDLPLGVL